jgi:hypothetical protein
MNEQRQLIRQDRYLVKVAWRADKVPSVDHPARKLTTPWFEVEVGAWHFTNRIFLAFNLLWTLQELL